MDKCHPSGVLELTKELTEMTAVADHDTGKRVPTLCQVDQGTFFIYFPRKTVKHCLGMEERLENSRFNVSGENDRQGSIKF